jgi:hypothetical protein
MRLLAILFLVASSAIARADQCAWIDRATAERAAELLHRGSKFVEWCEPCGEARPAQTEPQVVREVRVGQAEDPKYWQLTLNAKPIDLAYVFVLTAGDTYVNLASLASCPAEGVSRELHFRAPPKAHLRSSLRAP